MENEIEIEKEELLPEEEDGTTELDVEAEDSEEEVFEANVEEDTDDFEELCQEFPELAGKNADELYNTERYAQLRELGLTPKEAYLATAKVRAKFDNRSHLSSAVPKGAKSPSGKMMASELRLARELFSGASDQEIIRLYKRVTN